MILSTFFQFLVISIFSLIITIYLFEKLKSYAEGKTKLIGGSIKYGGGLGGFVVVFSLLFSAYTHLAIATDRTDIYLDGKWTLELIKKDGTIRKGSATINQIEGSKRLEIIGETESRTTPPSVSFSSLVAVLKDRSLIFLYENSRREMGIAIGHIQDNIPNKFSVSYYDVLSADTNKDPEGKIILHRQRAIN